MTVVLLQPVRLFGEPQGAVDFVEVFVLQHFLGAAVAEPLDHVFGRRTQQHVFGDLILEKPPFPRHIDVLDALENPGCHFPQAGRVFAAQFFGQMFIVRFDGIDKRVVQLLAVGVGRIEFQFPHLLMRRFQNFSYEPGVDRPVARLILQLLDGGIEYRLAGLQQSAKHALPPFGPFWLFSYP